MSNFPRCPQCGEPARVVILRAARVRCVLEDDGSAGRVLSTTRPEKSGERHYECGGGHVYEGTTMILFNVSFIDKNGLRTLVGPAQGRHMLPTREAAEKWLSAFLANNAPERLASIFGDQALGTFRVDPFDCYEHGDPKGIYVREP